MQERRIRGIVCTLTVLAVCLLVGVLPAQAEFEEKGSVSADRLTLRNLVGEIDVVGHNGSNFEIEVRVQGADATRERITFEQKEGASAEWNIIFPLDESKRYVYPRLGGNSSTSFDTQDGGWLSQLFSRGKIKVSGRGSGLEVWADVTVRVPSGKQLIVEHGVGQTRANDVDADLDLSSRSGRTEVANVNGELSVDTGSGRVAVTEVHGDVLVDTGSGRVSLGNCEGERVSVDTGSGRVELESVRTNSLSVDTGSGGVEAQRIEADDLTIDTGSGSVSLQLDRMGNGRFEIDTGSGSIDLRLPVDASARVDADTGSGGIKLDLASGYTLPRDQRDEARFKIGDGAADLRLDTGSGAIRISQ